MKLLKILLAAGLLVIGFAVNAEEIAVYRSPTCGCCEKWLAHLQENGFTIKDNITTDIQAIKTKYGVTPELASCHTAVINGYVIEGHVPADDINNLLKNKHKVVGLAVSGMPVGTPGMEMGGKKDAYDVVSFDHKNKPQVFNSYKGN
ncbi:MAG: DUF411 domain-containing protein [Methylovulum sp.]|nr:DUF411 domain-containing protein [Methylovulum sp.]